MPDFPQRLREATRAWRARVSVLATSVLVLSACDARDREPRDAAGQADREEAPQDAYAGSATCAECHAEAFAAWSGSHHDRAMQPAEDVTVLGDFDDASFTHFDVTSRFFERGGRFFVHTEGADGELRDFEVRYTFGVEPLQQYLIGLPDGRLQALGIAWDARPRRAGGQRWFHLYPDERIVPGDPLHWTGRYQTWNAMCAECHSTNLEKRYDPHADRYATRWGEIDVACEACHGPGGRHAEWARAVEGEGAPQRAERALPVDFRAGDSRYEVDACGRCHARRRRASPEDRPGRPLLDDFIPATLREGLYRVDGQIQAEVYVYGSFLQSAMYRRGVRCTDCHDPHSLTLRAEGGALCRQCHGEQSESRFPTLARKAYDTPAHHFHPPDSSGAQCVSCHMPARTYMGVDPRRDHSFRVPRPDLSARLGTPNACSGCHADRSPEWAAAAVLEWYGPGRRRDAHYAEVIAAGRAGDAGAVPALAALAADRERPAIVRATALELLSQYGPAASEALVAAASDEDPLVRATAAGRLDRAARARLLAAAPPLLEDPIRAVRTEAARVLASVPVDVLEPAARLARESALREYESAQLAMADTPAARLNLAVLYTSLGQTDRAEASYRTAIRMDPDFLPARSNLAILYSRTGRNPQAEEVLREALERAPDEGELHYSLGLVLAEEQRLEAAADSLARAARLLPERGRVWYNLGLARQQIGRPAEAEAALLEARRIDPGDPAVVEALAIFYVQQEEWPQARHYAEELVELAAEAPEPRRLLDRIRAELSAAGAPARP